MTQDRAPAVVGRERILVRLGEARATGRLADVLTGVALDVLHPFASEYLPADEYRELVRLLEPLSGEVAAAALAMPADELDRLQVSHELDPALRLEVLSPRRFGSR